VCFTYNWDNAFFLEFWKTNILKDIKEVWSVYYFECLSCVINMSEFDVEDVIRRKLSKRLVLYFYVVGNKLKCLFTSLYIFFIKGNFLIICFFVRFIIIILVASRLFIFILNWNIYLIVLINSLLFDRAWAFFILYIVIKLLSIFFIIKFPFIANVVIVILYLAESFIKDGVCDILYSHLSFLTLIV
jgi:hypothetical protein